MTTAAIQPGRAFLSFDKASSGTSVDADRIASKFLDFLCRYTDSATGNKRIAEPRQAIYDVQLKCNEANWGGEEEQPISRESALRAEELLLALPSYLPVPEIFPDPTGAISFEWYRRPKHRLVLSIYPTGIVEFAGLLGVGNEVYGSARLEGGLPNILRSQLRELFTD